MSAPAALTVSASLLKTLTKPIRNEDVYFAAINGDLQTRPVSRGPASLTPLNRHGRRMVHRFARRYQRSPDRERSIRRRRALAATWPMPPAMAGLLTTSQMAYSRIVADEVKRAGDCRLSLDEIAARGGMCRKTAKRAQDRLQELGWVAVAERPVQGRKHLPNVVAVTSKEWAVWIAKGYQRSRPIGGHSCPTTETQTDTNDREEPVAGSAGALDGMSGRQHRGQGRSLEQEASMGIELKPGGGSRVLPHPRPLRVGGVPKYHAGR